MKFISKFLCQSIISAIYEHNYFAPERVNYLCIQMLKFMVKYLKKYFINVLIANTGRISIKNNI